MPYVVSARPHLQLSKEELKAEKLKHKKTAQERDEAIAKQGVAEAQLVEQTKRHQAVLAYAKAMGMPMEKLEAHLQTGEEDSQTLDKADRDNLGTLDNVEDENQLVDKVKVDKEAPFDTTGFAAGANTGAITGAITGAATGIDSGAATGTVHAAGSIIDAAGKTASDALKAVGSVFHTGTDAASQGYQEGKESADQAGKAVKEKAVATKESAAEAAHEVGQAAANDDEEGAEASV